MSSFAALAMTIQYVRDSDAALGLGLYPALYKTGMRQEGTALGQEGTVLGRAERIPEEERLIREILKRNLNDFFPWESRVRKRRIARNKRLIPWM